MRTEDRERVIFYFSVSFTKESRELRTGWVVIFYSIRCKTFIRTVDGRAILRQYSYKAVVRTENILFYSIRCKTCIGTDWICVFDTFKPHTHKLYLLRHNTNIVYICFICTGIVYTHVSIKILKFNWTGLYYFSYVFVHFAALHKEKRKWKIFYLSWSVMYTILICFLTKMVSFY